MELGDPRGASESSMSGSRGKWNSDFNLSRGERLEGDRVRMRKEGEGSWRALLEKHKRRRDCLGKWRPIHGLSFIDYMEVSFRSHGQDPPRQPKMVTPCRHRYPFFTRSRMHGRQSGTQPLIQEET